MLATLFRALMSKLYPISLLPLPIALALGCDTRPTVYINEFMADNEDTLADGATGEYLDWIELYNASDEMVLLEGFYLTDQLLQPTQSPLSGRLAIGAESHLLLWAGEGAADDDTHLSFALAREGEQLALFWQDPATGNLLQLDAIDYQEQQTDVSMARDEDGFGAWVYQESPSPGTSNR